jgi:hypothetical protein
MLILFATLSTLKLVSKTCVVLLQSEQHSLPFFTISLKIHIILQYLDSYFTVRNVAYIVACNKHFIYVYYSSHGMLLPSLCMTRQMGQ